MRTSILCPGLWALSPFLRDATLGALGMSEAELRKEDFKAAAEALGRWDLHGARWPKSLALLLVGS